MPKRTVYHVTKNSSAGWDVKKEGGKRPSGHFDTKDHAVNRGRDLAKSSGLGQLKINPQAKRTNSD